MHVWLDLETTGLDASCHDILEVAVSLAPDSEPLGAVHAYHAVINYPREAWCRLDEFILKMHGSSGLLDECAKSQIDVRQAERAIVSLLPPGNNHVLAGSSVWFDHNFLIRHMPILASRLTYRHYDVSALKLVCIGEGMEPIAKNLAHRAKDDIAESVEHANRCVRWMREGMKKGACL